MAIEMFRPQYRTIQNPIDLNVLASTYNTLEKGHQQAVVTTAAYATKLAELDLNEAEDAWLQGEINKVRQALIDNMTYGNAAGALDNVVKTYGDIASNAGMVGRLRAQQDYKTYLANLEANDNLSEDYKNYYRQVNQYKYQDITDKDGNVIGGTKWTPVDREVDTIPMHEIYNQALKWAAKEQGGGNTVTFLDANGQPTTDVTKSATGEIYTNVSGQWVKLGKDKLMAAVNAAIESIPGAKASIAQDYKIAKWKYDEYGANPDVTDKSGYILTPEQYLTKRINPFIESASYYNQTSSIEYGNAWKAQLALANKQRSGVGLTSNIGARGSLMTTTTNPLSINNFMPTNAAAEINASKQIISNALSAANPNLNFNLDTSSYDDIKNLISNNITDAASKMQAIQALEQYTDAQEYLNSLKQGKSESQQAGFDFYNAVISMGDLPNNDYTTAYTKAANELFRGGDILRQNFSDQDTYDEFIAQLGGEAKAKSLGIELGFADGRRYAQLRQSNIKSLYAFADAANNAINMTHNLFGQTWQNLKNKFDINSGDGVVNVTPNGNKGVYIGNEYTNNSGAYAYRRLLSAVNDGRKKNDEVLDGGKITHSMNTVLEFSPTAAELRIAYNSGQIEASDFNARYKLATEDANKMRSIIDLTQTGVMIVDPETNVYRKATSEEAKQYTAQIRNAKDNEVEFVMGQDFETGQWSPFITLKIDETPVTLYAPGGYDNADIQSWNRDTQFRALNDVGIYHASNRPLNITNSAAFANIDKFTLQPDGVGFSIINKAENKVTGYVSREQAVQLRDVYHQWNDTYNAVTSGVQGYTLEAVQSIAMTAATQLATLTGSGNNQDVITYYYQQLISNLKGY